MGAAGRIRAGSIRADVSARHLVNWLGPERVLDAVVEIQGRPHIHGRREAAIGKRSMVGHSKPTVVHPFAFADAHRLVTIRRAKGGKKVRQEVDVLIRSSSVICMNKSARRDFGSRPPQKKQWCIVTLLRPSVA